jgi:hypothetical protein
MIGLAVSLPFLSPFLRKVVRYHAAKSIKTCCI